MLLPYGEENHNLSSTIFDLSTRVTDRQTVQTDGRGDSIYAICYAMHIC